MDLRLEAQRHGIAGIDKHRRHHHGVALVEIEREQRGQVAMRCGQGHAAQCQRETGDLRQGKRGAKQHIVHHENHHRDAGLFDDGIDGAGILQGGIEKGIEGGEANGAVAEQEQPVPADDREIAAHLRGRDRRIRSTVQAMTQRKPVSIIGLTWPTAIFPATVFPPQIRVVMHKMI